MRCSTTLPRGLLSLDSRVCFLKPGDLDFWGVVVLVACIARQFGLPQLVGRFGLGRSRCCGSRA